MPARHQRGDLGKRSASVEVAPVALADLLEDDQALLARFTDQERRRRAGPKGRMRASDGVLDVFGVAVPPADDDEVLDRPVTNNSPRSRKPRSPLRKSGPSPMSASVAWKVAAVFSGCPQ